MIQTVARITENKISAIQLMKAKHMNDPADKGKIS